MSCLWLNPIALPFALLMMMLYRLFQGAPDNESRIAYFLALLFVAVIVRVVLLPFQMRSKRGMLKQTRLQPKIAELQKRHGANKQKLNEEMAKLYKDEGVNPASGCLWSFIQMPIMIALFYAIRQPISLMMGLESDLWLDGREGFNTAGRIYGRFVELINQGVVTIPERLLDAETGFYNASDFYVELYMAQDISTYWEHFRNIGIDGLHRISFYLGNINLAEIPNYRVWEYEWSSGAAAWGPAVILFLLPVLSGGSQFLSAHILRKTQPQPTEQASGTGATMMKLMPLMSVWFGFILPAALSVYWTIGTFLQIAQDLWLNKRYTKILDAEDAVREQERREKEAEIEAKRLETERLKAEGKITENPNKSKRKKQKVEKQGQREKAAEWEKKHAPKDEKESKDEPGRVGNRRYARGRAYDPDRFKHGAAGSADESDDADESEGAAEADAAENDIAIDAAGIDIEEDAAETDSADEPPADDNDDYAGYDEDDDEED